MRKPPGSKRFRTFVDGHPRGEDDPNPLAPIEAYVKPSDVPIPLQQNIALAVSTGLTPKQLSVIYEIPEEWIEMFVKGGWCTRIKWFEGVIGYPSMTLIY